MLISGSFDPSPFADKDLDAFEDAPQYPATDCRLGLLEDLEDAMIDQRKSSGTISVLSYGIVFVCEYYVLDVNAFLSANLDAYHECIVIHEIGYIKAMT